MIRTIYQGLNSFAACFGGFIFRLPGKLSVMWFHRLRLIPDDDILKGKLHARFMHSKQNAINYPVCQSTRSASFWIAAGFVCNLDVRIFNRFLKIFRVKRWWWIVTITPIEMSTFFPCAKMQCECKWIGMVTVGYIHIYWYTKTGKG